METETEEKQDIQHEMKSKEKEPKALKDSGELVFQRLESQGALFYQNKFKPLSIRQRRANTHFILINSDKQYKTYQIKDNQLQFVSEHTIDLPILSRGYFRMLAEEHLHYFFKKKGIDKRERAVKFFEENDIDWNKPSYLGFGLRIGIDQPERINPYYLGESFYTEHEKESSKVRDFFDNQKPLLNQGICLFMGSNQKEADLGLAERGQVYYLSRFGKKYPDLANHIFQFNLKEEKLGGYEQKRIEDWGKISPKVTSLTNFYKDCQCFEIDNDEPGCAKKFMPFTQIGKNMIVVGLVDIRKRIIPIKRLVSMYELLAEIDFKHPPSVSFFNILKIDYSAELDVLILDAWLNFYFLPDNRDKIHSVILNGIDEVAGKKKQGFLREMGNDRIKEIQKLRFKVWGVLKSRKLRIEVEILGYRGFQSFRKGQGMVTSFDEDSTGVRLSIFSHGTQQQLERSNASADNGMERKAQKAIKETKKVKRTDIDIVKKELVEDTGFIAAGIRSAVMINNEHLLVTSSNNLLLFDINSKELISACRYSENIPVFQKNTIICNNIILNLKLRLNIVEIFKISQNENEIGPPCFQSFGLLNFSSLVDNLFEIERVIGFRSREDQYYELNMVAKVMESADCAIMSKKLFFVEFMIQDGTEHNEQNPGKDTYVTSVCDVDFLEDDIRIYQKNNRRNHIFFNGVHTAAIQDDRDDGGETCLIFNGLEGFQAGGYRIVDVHIDRDLIFTEQAGAEGKIIQVVQALDQDEDGEISKAEVRNVLSLDTTTKVYFDEVTELFRIFVFKKNLGSMELKILDQGLDVVEKFFISFLDELKSFKVISAKIVHLIGREPPTAEGGISVDFPYVSILLDLEKLTYKRLVVEGEGPMFGAPLELETGGFLAFTRDLKSFTNKSSDGIFYSTNHD